MAIITQAAAIVVANTIRDEVIVNANTCLRVGGLLRDMVDSMWPGDHADSHLPGSTDALDTGAPVSIGSINAEGNAAAFSRQDHVHAHGEQGGGNQHTIATTVRAGFMSGAQVVALGDASSHVAITNGNPHGTSIANIGQGTLAQLNTAISDFDIYSTEQVDALVGGYVPTSRTLTAGNGLLGGGDLSQNRSFAVGALDGTIVSASGGVRVGTLLSTNFSDHTIAPARITNGTNGQVLTMVSGDPAWASRASSDYTQFLLLDGTRSMSGALNMGGQQITNVGNVDGVDISAHAARHLPGGADALAVDTPVSLGDSLGIGSRASFSRSDHVHTHGNRPGGTLHALATTSAAGFMSGAQVTAVANATSHIANTSNPHATTFANLSGGTAGVVTNATISASAAIAVTKLALGDANSVLWSNGTANSWSTRPTLLGMTLSNSAQAVLSILSTGTSNSIIYFGTTSNANDGAVYYENTNRRLMFRASDTTAMLLSSGDLSPADAGRLVLGGVNRWGAGHFAGGSDFVSTGTAVVYIVSGGESKSVLALGRESDRYRGGLEYDNILDQLTIAAGDGPAFCVNRTDISPASVSGTIGSEQRVGAAYIGTVDVSSRLQFGSQPSIPGVPSSGVCLAASGGHLYERSSEGGLWQLSPTAPPDICRVQRVIRLQDVASATTTLTLPELIPFVPESPALGGPYYGFFWVNVRMMCRYRGGATYTEHASLSSFIFRIYRPYGSSTYTISVNGMGADNVYHQHGGASFDYPRISSFSGSGTTPTANVWIVPGSSSLYPGTYVGQLDIFGPINTGADGDWAST